MLGPCAKLLTITFAAVSFIALSEPAYALRETTVAEWKACVDAQISVDKQISTKNAKYAKVHRKLEETKDFRGLCLFAKKTGIPSFREDIKNFKRMLSDFCSHPTRIVDGEPSYHAGVGKIVQNELDRTVEILEDYKKQAAANCAKAGID